MIVFKDFTFSAAHTLAKVRDGHKCKNLHGHNYRVRVECSSTMLNAIDMVIDFDDIKAATKPIIGLLDHQFINAVVGYDNTTAEWICGWLAERLIPQLPLLSAIEVWETETCGARWER